MKQKLLLIGFLFLQINIAFAQICGTPFVTPKNGDIKQKLKVNRQPPPACINILFHIVRDDNGNDNSLINENDLSLIINNLNSTFNMHGISFTSRGYDYIDNSDYIVINSNAEAGQMGESYNVSNAINYYIVDALWNRSIAGTSVTIPSKNLAIRKSEIQTMNSSHEVGHCLGLYHTFQGTNPNTLGCAEDIIYNELTCSNCGDMVCDTPADNGNGNNNGYSPDLNNIMSYYNNRTQFTSGQARKIFDTLEDNIDLINEVVSLSCETPTLNNIDFLCYPNSETFSIDNLDNDTVTWETSSNLNIESTTFNSITIEANNSLSFGVAWVEATLSTGYVIRDNFWIGKPFSNNLVIYSSGAFNISTQRWYQLTAHHQDYDFNAHSNLTYEWQIPYAQLRMTPPKDKIISVFPTETGTYPYKLRSKNVCGCSDWLNAFFTISGSPGDDDIFISRTQN
jgi:hypothetical protein